MSDDSRTRLRNELLAGAASEPTKPADRTYFDQLRQQVLNQASIRYTAYKET